MRNFIFAVIFGVGLPHMAFADDRLVRLYAPETLVETGLLRHILPRFSLKTQVKVELVDSPDAADVALGSTGQAIFNGLAETWHLDITSRDHDGTARFADWLTSEVGQRTVFGFEVEGETPFSAPEATAEVAVVPEMTAEAIDGRHISKVKCGRCHVTERSGSMGGIGSTPSFFVLRTLDDWETRFASFFLLNPHPAFTQVEDITEPFAEDRPSPIVPIELTLDEYDAIQAYVAVVEAADLGAPLQHQ